jgi:hypothetical protein
MKAILILIVGVSNPVVDKTEFATVAQCEVAKQSVWAQYVGYENWSRSDAAKTPPSTQTINGSTVTVGSPLTGPTIHIPVVYCMETDAD